LTGRRLAVGALCALWLAVPLTAGPLGKRIPKVCAQLQSDGWTAPVDLRTKKPGRAEMNIPGVMYMCTLEHLLTGKGTGHAPDLQALLSNDGDDESLILSADVWCEADEAATFDALAKQLERSLGGAPEAVTQAIRARKKLRLEADGMAFIVEPIEVDADACAHVRPDQLVGPVRIKIDVAVKSKVH
jgi:hypothetical protein